MALQRLDIPQLFVFQGAGIDKFQTVSLRKKVHKKAIDIKVTLTSMLYVRFMSYSY